MTNFYIKNSSLSASEKLKKRCQLLADLERPAEAIKKLSTLALLPVNKVSSRNCENLIGSVEIPVGVAGPVETADLFLQQPQKKAVRSTLRQILIPLATTEGALVASIARGIKVFNQSSPVRVFVEKVGMTRAPVFELSDGQAARKFVEWLNSRWEKVKQAAEQTSHHLALIDHQVWIEGRLVFVRFVFDTDQAMGMNMVTLGVKAAWEEVISSYPDVSLISVSSNVCVDKKASAVNRLLGRGYGVQAEVEINSSTLKQVLKTDPSQLVKIFHSKIGIGSNLAGSLDRNMHAANAIAALFLATGQDMAHVVEGAQVNTIIEPNFLEIGLEGGGSLRKDRGPKMQEQAKKTSCDKQGVYAAVNLHNINLGVVGGGTYLPKFKAAREIILGRSIKTEELAAVVGLTVLAGELSGLAALANHSLTAAHQELGRG